MLFENKKDYFKICIIMLLTFILYTETYKIAVADLMDFKLLSAISGMVFSYLFKAIFEEISKRKNNKPKDD